MTERQKTKELGSSGLNWSVMIRRARVAENQLELGNLLELYRNYLNLIAQTQIGATLKKRVDPSDVVQETFLEAHRDFGEFRGNSEAELIAWLRKILIRNLYDQVKRHHAQRRDCHREQSLEAAIDRSSMQIVNALGADISSPSHRASEREQAVLVADAIAALPPIHRQVMLMRQVQRIPFAEIGIQLEKSPGAIRMIWLRALEKLKQSLR